MHMDQNNSSQQQSILPEEEGIDMKKYIFLILSHWWWFGISVFVALTIAYMVNRYTQNYYQVSSSIVVGDEFQSGSAPGRSRRPLP